MTPDDAARQLGATINELETALSGQLGPEVAVTGGGLRMDQAAAAFHVLTSGRRVEVIVGPAGSGKTRVLAGIGRAWAHSRVVGSRRHSHRATCWPQRESPNPTTSPSSSGT